MNKVHLVSVILLFLSLPLAAQETVAINPASTGDASNDRTLLPQHWFRGYTQFEGAPPTNEPDLGRCAPVALRAGASSTCTAYARYMVGGYLEIQPLGRTPLRHLFLFYEPRVSLGRNVPQHLYTASFAPMAYDRAMGIGFDLPRNLEVRILQHRVDWLGRYRRDLGAADLGKNGPYGLYTTIGLRWYFGGYGRAHGAAY